MNIFYLVPTVFVWTLIIMAAVVAIQDSSLYLKTKRFVKSSLFCRGGDHLWQRRYIDVRPEKDDMRCVRCDTKLSSLKSNKLTPRK